MVWDATTKATFQAAYAAKSVRLIRVALIAGMLLSLPFGLGLSIPQDNLPTVRLAVFGFALPALALSLAITWTRLFSLASQTITIVVSLGIATLTVFTNLNYPEPHYTYRTVMALLVVLAFMFMLGRLFLKGAIIASVLALAGVFWLGIVAKPMGEADRGLSLGWIVLMCVAGCVSAWMQERYARTEFHLQRLLDIEKQKSENVLLNVLPAPIAFRLRESRDAIAEQVDDASVLFCDIVGFTPYAASRSADEVVRRLNTIFSAFDALVEQHGLEKIKTVGDAFMVAGGVLGPDPTHLERIASLALALRAESEANDWKVRIGIHVGPLVAGVIGSTKLLFDLWGATVNLASRLESHGEAAKIQVSEAVRDRLQGKFIFRSERQIEVKGVGKCSVWFLDSKVK